MRKVKKTEKLLTALLCALIGALGLTLLTAMAVADPSSESETGRATVTMTVQSGDHVKYMSGDENGLFRPEEALTRGELAQMLYGVTAERPASLPIFVDVPPDAWYSPAVQSAAGLGLMTGEGGRFRPGEAATRAECAYALAQLLPSGSGAGRESNPFPDVWQGNWAYEAICRTTEAGLFHGDSSGQFRPNDGLRRSEAVTVFNRLLGRSPDMQTLSARTDLYQFADVPRTHWAYGEIMEAAVTHQAVAAAGGEHWTAVVAEAPVAAATPAPETEAPAATSAPAKEAAGLPDGPVRREGRLYWVKDEQFVRDQAVNGLWFDEEGRYTTGDAELDATLNSIVNEYTNDAMTRDQKLRALYDYVVGNYTYLARPLVAKGTVGWEQEYAKFFFTNRRGNCFSFAAAYDLLCLQLGLPAYTVVGTSGGSPHGWVQIPLDGSTYMFDPELQWYYNNRTTKQYNLFKMLPTRVPRGVYRYAW